MAELGTDTVLDRRTISSQIKQSENENDGADDTENSR